jgi:hypothetical protein
MRAGSSVMISVYAQRDQAHRFVPVADGPIVDLMQIRNAITLALKGG